MRATGVLLYANDVYTSNLVPFMCQRKLILYAIDVYIRHASCVLYATDVYIRHKHEHFWGALPTQMHVHWHIKRTLYVRAGHVVHYKHLVRWGGCPVAVKIDLEPHIFLLKTWLTGEELQANVLTILTKQ